jgi:hypothetical protein
MNVPVRFDRLGCLLTVAVLAGLGLFLALNSALNADEGFYLAASRLVADGYRPYADFGYTQGPVLPYANVPWLELFGYNLTGLRLAGLAWGLITVITGVTVLYRRATWIVAAVFTGLLLGAPVWLDFVAKGKTYAFAGLAVLAGVIALTSRGPLPRRWVCFILAATLGTGARYPMAGFFAPAWLCLLLLTPGWRARAIAVAATAAMAAGVLALVGAGNWERFYFWTVAFHGQSTFAFSRLEQFRYFLLFAPAAWIAASAGAWRSRQEAGLAPSMAFGALALGLVVNLMGTATYAEYVFPFVPAAAFLGAPVMAGLFSRVPWSARGLLAVAVLGAGWIHPPQFDRGLLRDANQAAAFLQAHVAPPAVVAGSMPEIAVAAARRIPLMLAMGKYSITEDLDATQSAQLGMTSPAVLLGVLRDPETKALVISPVLNWNFFWSLPSYRWLSEKARTDIRQAVTKDYGLAYSNANYVILLRKP